MGLPTQRRKTLMQQCGAASPTPARGPLYSWVTHTPGLAKPAKQERRAKQKAAESALKAATPAAKPEPLRTLSVTEMKRGRDGV